MDIFHSTIKDVQKLFKQKNYAPALSLFRKKEEHITRVYQALNMLKKDLDDLHKNMQAMDNAIVNSGKVKQEVKIDKKSFDERVKDFERKIGNVSSLVKQLKLHSKLAE